MKKQKWMITVAQCYTPTAIKTGYIGILTLYPIKKGTEEEAWKNFQCFVYDAEGGKTSEGVTVEFDEENREACSAKKVYRLVSKKEWNKDRREDMLEEFLDTYQEKKQNIAQFISSLKQSLKNKWKLH